MERPRVNSASATKDLGHNLVRRVTLLDIRAARYGYLKGLWGQTLKGDLVEQPKLLEGLLHRISLQVGRRSSHKTIQHESRPFSVGGFSCRLASVLVGVGAQQ